MARVAERAPAPANRRARPRHRRQKSRSWPRRVLIGSCVVTSLCLLATLGGWAYVTLRIHEIHRVAVPAISTPPPAGEPENILVVGSDSRAALPPSAAAHFGSAQLVQGQRSDVIILIHLVPATEQAAILSIPRDLVVPIAGTTRHDRINSAFNSGPNQLVQTIETYFDIPVNHYIEVNFDGFQSIVDAVGGVKLSFPFAARDAMTGLKVPAGCDTLNGAAALGLARSRDYEYLQNGYWHSDGTGDLGRIQRQHVFLKVLAQQAISAGIHNPITANTLISSTVNDVTIDNGFTTADLVQLALGFKRLQPNQVPTYTVPTYAVNGYAGLGDVLFAQQPGAKQVVFAFLATGTAPTTTTTTPGAVPPAPGSVTVRVLNGSGTAHQAGQAAAGLTQAGFKVSGSGDAATFRYSQSVVLYPAGQGAAAQLVHGYVGGGAQVQEDDSLSGTGVTLVTGSSFAGIHASSASPSSLPGSPSSTAPGATGSAPTAPAPVPYPAFDPVPC